MKPIFILYKEEYENEPISVYYSLNEAKLFKDRILKQLGVKLRIKQKIILRSKNESNNKTK